MSKRVLAVDPGDKRIGLAISDESGTIANPFAILAHKSRLFDSAAIALIAKERRVGLIIVGYALDSDDKATTRSRKAERLADSIRSQTDIPVSLWDEYGSTQEARRTYSVLKGKNKRIQSHFDQLAAAIILQTYLDSTNVKKGHDGL